MFDPLVFAFFPLILGLNFLHFRFELFDFFDDGERPIFAPPQFGVGLFVLAGL
jgi:hypothetical protein